MESLLDYKKEMKKVLEGAAGRYSANYMFRDWVYCFALALSQQVFFKEEREKNYLQTIGKYSKEEQKAFVKLCGLTMGAFSLGCCDILGELYMETQMGQKQCGQFFTPWSVCELCAEITMAEADTQKDVITLHDPCVGSGAMMLAGVKVLEKKGVELERIEVVGQDIDMTCVCMAYIQFSLLGIPATVVHGNSLTEPYTGKDGDNNVFYSMALAKKRLAVA